MIKCQYQAIPHQENFGNLRRRCSTRSKVAALSFLGIISTIYIIFMFSGIPVYPQISIQNHNITIQDSQERATHNLYYLMFIIGICLLIIGGGNLLSLFCHFVGEFQHLKTRHKSRITNLIQYSFEGSMLYIILLLSGTFCVAYVSIGDNSAIRHLISTGLHIVVFGIVLLAVVMINKACFPTPLESYMTGKTFAWTMYLTYLKRILDPSLHQRIDQFETLHSSKDGYKTQISVRKLFILIPSSCRAVPGNLAEGDENLEYVGDLPPLQFQRTGNFRRSFTNSVYKVKRKGNEPFYCIAEGASALQTLHDMCNLGSELTGISSSEKDIQRNLFIQSLHEILQTTHKYSDLCIILPFEDRTEDGEDVLISTVLNEKIEELLNQKTVSQSI